MAAKLLTSGVILGIAWGHPDGSWMSDGMMSELAARFKEQLQFEAKSMMAQQEIPGHDQNGESVTLVTFDNAKGTTYSWRAMNDPVMGGQSHSSFSIESSEGHFKGTCAIVPFLKAPGFCKIGTQSSLIRAAPKFVDASRFIDGALYLEVETTTPEYEGYKVAFGAKNATRPPGSFHHSSPSFKAAFQVPGTGRTTVKVHSMTSASIGVTSRAVATRRILTTASSIIAAAWSILRSAPQHSTSPRSLPWRFGRRVSQETLTSSLCQLALVLFTMPKYGCELHGMCKI